MEGEMRSSFLFFSPFIIIGEETIYDLIGFGGPPVFW